MILLISMLGCDRPFEDYGEPWIPSLSHNNAPPVRKSTNVRRIEEYMLPAGVDTQTPARQDCLQGEDVRGWYQPTYAFVEVQRWGVMLNGMYTVSLNDGILDPVSTRGQLIGELYDALLEMRTTGESLSAGMPCWPEASPRLLILADDAESWSVVERVVHTGWQAGFDHVDLLVDDSQARNEAESSQPRPAFVPGARGAAPPPDYLSDEEVQQGLEQLRRGYRLRPGADSCHDRLTLSLDGDTTHLEPRALGAGQLEGLQPTSLTGAEGPVTQLLTDWVEDPSRVDVQISAAEESSWVDVLALVEETSQALPGASLSLVDGDQLGPSQTRLGAVPSAVYTSYGHQQWVSVIELSPPSLGLSLACGG